MMMTLLNVDDLHVNYGKIRALQGVSFFIEENEIVSIIGANGAGKTTLLSLLTGLMSPDKGTMVFDGNTLNQKKPHEIVAKGIIQVPEGRGILKKITVRENLLLGGIIRKDKRETIETDLKEMYEKFPILYERRKSPAGVLSGGEQQILALARALMAKPRLLLLDEPSMGLAPIIIKTIFNLISDINKTGVSVLVVEQSAKMAIKISSRVYVIANGRIVSSGSSDQFSKDKSFMDTYLGIKKAAGSEAE